MCTYFDLDISMVLDMRKIVCYYCVWNYNLKLSFYLSKSNENNKIVNQFYINYFQLTSPDGQLIKILASCIDSMGCDLGRKQEGSDIFFNLK